MAETENGTTTDLSESLYALGAALPESHRPVPHQVPTIVSGLLYWLETGSLEPPKVVEDASPVVTPADVKVAELEAELASERAKAAQAAAPIQPAVPVASPGQPGPETPTDLSPQSPSTVAPPAGEGSPAPTPGDPQSPPVSDVPSSPAS